MLILCLEVWPEWLRSDVILCVSFLMDMAVRGFECLIKRFDEDFLDFKIFNNMQPLLLLARIGHYKGSSPDALHPRPAKPRAHDFLLHGCAGYACTG